MASIKHDNINDKERISKKGSTSALCRKGIVLLKPTLWYRRMMSLRGCDTVLPDDSDFLISGQFQMKN